MAYAKNKYSSKMHAPKTRFLSASGKTFAQKTILAVIVLAILLVITSVACVFIFDNERITKNKISNLASKYYENYFYPSMSIDKNKLSEIMSQYTDTGFNNTTLRQIILANGEDYTSDAEFIRKYCDENSTLIRFFPEPPYDNTSYRVEYSYSCSF